MHHKDRLIKFLINPFRINFNICINNYQQFLNTASLEFNQKVSRRYVPFDGPAQVNLSYSRFVDKLNSESKIGQTKVISDEMVIGASSLESTIDNNEKPVIGNDNRSY